VVEPFARLVQHLAILSQYELEMSADEVVFVVWNPREDEVCYARSSGIGSPGYLPWKPFSASRVGFIVQLSSASPSAK
jgi:hypothetical protein